MAFIRIQATPKPPKVIPELSKSRYNLSLIIMQLALDNKHKVVNNIPGVPSNLCQRTGYESPSRLETLSGSQRKKMALSEEDIASSLSEPDQATKGFTFQQTMLRVKDPKASLDFYTRVMGMRSVRRSHSPFLVQLHTGYLTIIHRSGGEWSVFT